jgi:hypothetical protein
MSKTVPQLDKAIQYLIGSAAEFGVHEIPFLEQPTINGEPSCLSSRLWPWAWESTLHVIS